MKTPPKYAEIEKFKADLEKCTRCGFCMSACPVYREEKVESSVARGKIVHGAQLLSGDLKETKEMEEMLNRCTLCMTAPRIAPPARNVPAVITAARADKVKHARRAFPLQVIYRYLLPRRRLFGYTIRWLPGSRVFSS